jgi:UMF1 family MFS transporter
MDRRAALAWCLFDWANSGFPAVVSTFVIAAYVTRSVAPDVESGTAAWGTAISLAGIAIAFTGPVLGAVADAGGRRKPWLATLSGLCILLTAAMWFVRPEASDLTLALVLVGLATVAFESSVVFYNAMLPEVAPPRMVGRLSGWAWGLGYAGGLAALALALTVFVQPETPPLGLDKETAEHVRITGPLVALWWLVFGLPLLVYVPDPVRLRRPLSEAIGLGLRTLGHTLKRLPQERRIARFLIARMLYTDGLNTLFSFGGIYAAGTFGMSFQEILVFAILLNVFAGLGAAGFAWVDDWFGPKLAIVVSVVGLMVFGSLALVVEDKWVFTALGCAMGIFMGPAQAASRSFMARLAPPETRVEMFGLYALSGKVTAFLGPATVGWVTAFADSQRVGMATIIVFLLAGLVVLLPVKDPGLGVLKAEEQSPKQE